MFSFANDTRSCHNISGVRCNFFLLCRRARQGDRSRQWRRQERAVQSNWLYNLRSYKKILRSCSELYKRKLPKWTKTQKPQKQNQKSNTHTTNKGSKRKTMYMGPEAINLSTWTTPISINSKAKFDRENKVRQANKVVMPCIEPYTKLAGQKRGKGSRVKSEEFSMHWWRFNGVRTLVVLYFFQTIFKVRFQKPFPGYSFFLVVGKHEDKRICNRDEPSPRGGQGSAPWQEGAERQMAQTKRTGPSAGTSCEKLSHYHWGCCEAKCGEVSIDALLQKREHAGQLIMEHADEEPTQAQRTANYLQGPGWNN